MIAADNERHLERHLTTLDLDQLAMADLSPWDLQRIDAHAGRCPRCTARRSEHAAAAAQFRVTVLPRTLPLIQARQRPWHARLWAPAIAVPALAVAILVLAHRFDGPRSGTKEPPALGIKGDQLMQVFALHHSEAPGGGPPVCRGRRCGRPSCRRRPAPR